jgi:hypothetical protein
MDELSDVLLCALLNTKLKNEASSLGPSAIHYQPWMLSEVATNIASQPFQLLELILLCKLLSNERG